MSPGPFNRPLMDRWSYCIGWTLVCTGLTFCPNCACGYTFETVAVKAALVGVECCAGCCVFWIEATIKPELWINENYHEELDELLYCKACDGCAC
mmetsp:Transcript_9677/g.20350  ORF Transcript_9677/g.20350 Transcript_9677/m.20350 type:complete len:95 (+) Transcript_9677:225-509(+)